jgi:hypothetical protein
MTPGKEKATESNNPIQIECGKSVILAKTTLTFSEGGVSKQ